MKIHRDVKASHILLDEIGDAKLGGVDLGRGISSEKRKTLIRTPYWMAPEILSNEIYNTKV
jgi:serine/threonine protein kinase